MKTRSVLGCVLAFCALVLVGSAPPVHASIPPNLLASAPLPTYPSEAAVGSGYFFWSEHYIYLHRMTDDLTGDEMLPLPSIVQDVNGLFVGRDGLLYVSDSWVGGYEPRQLHKLTLSGSLVASLCDPSQPGGIAFGWDFVVAPQGDIYAACRNPSVRKFSSTGMLLRTWAEEGSAPGQTKGSIMGIALDAYEHVYILDAGNNRVQVFDPNGAFLYMWSIPFAGGSFAMDDDGHVFVGDRRKKEVHVYDQSGIELGKWGTSEPIKLMVDRDQDVYVLGSDRVQKFERISTPAPPDIPPAEPAVLLHIVPAVPGMACMNTPTEYDDVVTHADAVSPEGTPYYVYFLASPRTLDGGSAGITGIQATLTYDHGTSPPSGIKVWSWNHCAEMEFPQDGWPQSGSGNTITWFKSTCQQKLLVPVGYLYIGAYSPAAMAVTGYSSTDLVKVANCDGAERVVEAGRQGWISIGGATYSGRVGNVGCNPLVESCTAPVAVRSATWGQIKTLYH